jgi:tetratricopeptide (TPR) repeat protein
MSRRLGRRWLWVTLLCVGAYGGLSPGLQAVWAAGDPAEVEALIARGVELRRAGKDAQALPLFKRAHNLVDTPRTSAQLGLVELQLGYQVEAEQHLRKALASPEDFWIHQNKGALQGALAQLTAQLAVLQVEGDRPGTEVWVNQRLVGTLPLPEPVRVKPGPVTVELKVPPAGPTRKRSLVATAGRTERLAFVVGEPMPPARGTGEQAPPAIARRAAPRTPALPATAEAAARAPTRSHAGRFGAFLRIDIALLPESGQRLAPGVSVGLTERLELNAAALLGKATKGAWLGARWFLLDGAFKPELKAGLPIFVDSGKADVGLQGAAGVTVELGAGIALFADLGAVLFPGAPVEAGGLWLLPSLGVQARY